MEKVEELVKEIHGTITQTTGSHKDEVRVMRAMMNDITYKVDVYDKSGATSQFVPSEAVRDMAASIISGATKVSIEEAKVLANNYEFKKNEAEVMVDTSKEFINTYIHTGRKISIGGRKKSDISFSLKEIEPGTRTFPKAVGVDKDGNTIYERGVTKVDGYESIKVYSPCPAWIKKETK